MRKNIINLADTLKLFKKNLRSFYMSTTAGILIGIIAIFININYIEKKTTVSSKISIRSPLQNYLLLDLFSLDTIEVSDQSVSIVPAQTKILNYYTISREYLELMVATTNYSKYNLDQEKYSNFESEIKEKDFIITIKNIRNPKEIENSLKMLVNDFNKIIQPMILNNILTETAFIENFLEKSNQNSYNEKLAILIKIRNETIEILKDTDFEIFELFINTKIQEISNLRLFIVSILISFSFFLLFIILRK